MANKPKVGLDYFPCEVILFGDKKTKKLIRKFNGSAVTIYLYLLCEVYKNGYFLEWDEDLPGEISDATRLEESFILEVIHGAIAVGLFSQQMWDDHKILTSVGIQTRYAYITKTSKRKNNVSEYNLIPSEELNQSTEEKTQTKQKETKQNKSKENERENSAPNSVNNFEIKKSLDDCADSLSKDSKWIELVCMKESKSEQEILDMIPIFKLHCGTIRTGDKTEKDFAEHFMNWIRKGKNYTTNGKRSTGGFPDHWDKTYEAKLQGPELTSYWQHLRTKGLEPLRNRFKTVIDWIPAAQQMQTAANA